MQNLDSIRQRVYQIDAIVKVLELASLQIERDGFVDTLRIVKAINWEVHYIVEKMDTPNKVVDLTIVNDNDR